MIRFGVLALNALDSEQAIERSVLSAVRNLALGVEVVRASDDPETSLMVLLRAVFNSYGDACRVCVLRADEAIAEGAVADYASELAGPKRMVAIPMDNGEPAFALDRAFAHALLADMLQEPIGQRTLQRFRELILERR